MIPTDDDPTHTCKCGHDAKEVYVSCET